MRRSRATSSIWKFGVFPGDNGCFSITLCVPEVEEELRKKIVDLGRYSTRSAPPCPA